MNEFGMNLLAILIGVLAAKGLDELVEFIKKEPQGLAPPVVLHGGEPETAPRCDLDYSRKEQVMKAFALSFIVSFIAFRMWRYRRNASK